LILGVEERMTHIDEIKKVLSRQINFLKELLDVLRKERDCLVEHNVKELNVLSKEKDTICLWLKLLSDEIKGLMNKYALENNIDGDINIDLIYKHSGESDLKFLKLQLISLSQSLMELNDFNRILMERSLNFYKEATDFFESFDLSDKRDTGLILSKEI
jgi:flagellar biosynthesis/type III secretory pathway chaperone